MKEFTFEKDSIKLFECRNMKDVERNIEQVFKDNQKILPRKKDAKILVKPNLNNDLNALTGNSTDLRVIISVLRALKKRKYSNVTLADGPNCGVNHIGIDVFSRLSLRQVAKMFDIKLMNLNKDKGRIVKLLTDDAEIAESILDSDFIIDLPKIKTHMEAKITIACKNYMGGLKGTEKRKMHENLPGNIVRLNEIIKTDLIIVDGLVAMEGNGPGAGIPKKLNVILSGHNPYVMDFLCSKLMGFDYNKIPFLKIALGKGHLSQNDVKDLGKVEKIADFLPAKQNLFSKILLYKNVFINIRFSKPFQRFFDSGIIPWLLFKMGVRQDQYIHREKEINKLSERPGLSAEGKEKLRKCLEVYCPIGMERLDDERCLKCMYCYQIVPDLINLDGDLGAFGMQIERFGKFVKE